MRHTAARHTRAVLLTAVLKFENPFIAKRIFVRISYQRLCFLPNIILSRVPPILRSNPPRVVGMPVLRATFCFNPVMPTARFQEKDKPGIIDFLAIIY